jgi:hypothetical protein
VEDLVVALRQRGSVTLLTAMILVLIGVGALGLGRLGVNAVSQARARTAADAAALAGAAEGEGAARELAAANGGRMLRFEVEGNDTLVEVAVDGVRARARARREGGAHSSVHRGMEREMSEHGELASLPA